MEARFHRSMVRIYEEAKKIGYTPSYFLQMLSKHGGVEAARRLINSDTPSEGFTRLWIMKRLDLTVEVLVLQPEWEALFTDMERQKARNRLEEYGFQTTATTAISEDNMRKKIDVVRREYVRQNCR